MKTNPFFKNSDLGKMMDSVKKNNYVIKPADY
jgi:hypothetical protein